MMAIVLLRQCWDLGSSEEISRRKRIKPGSVELGLGSSMYGEFGSVLNYFLRISWKPLKGIYCLFTDFLALPRQKLENIGIAVFLIIVCSEHSDFNSCTSR